MDPWSSVNDLPFLGRRRMPEQQLSRAECSLALVQITDEDHIGIGVSAGES
jgi:hypothetical protein